MRKKICIDCRMVECSGIGTYLKNIVSRLIVLLDDVDFFLVGKEDILKLYLDINCRNCFVVESSAPIFSLKEQLELYRRIPRGISLMWSPHFNIPIFYSGKLLVTIHDVFPLALPQYVGGKHKYLCAKFLFWLATKKANKFLTVSQFTKKEMIRLLKVDIAKILPIYLGVDDSFFDVLKGPRSPHERPFILFVGNVKRHKNLVTLIKAFCLVKNDIDCDLVIVGNKDSLKSCDEEIEKLCMTMNDRIFLTGFLKDEHLKQYYKYAELFVFPSLYEGFGLPILEAMAMGCPVLSSKAASLTEVGGDAVEYFDPCSVKLLAEKIKCLYNDKNHLKDMSQKGYRQARKFKWDICVNKIINVLNLYE